MAAKMLTLTAANFEAVVLQGALPAMVVFSAPWCAACRALEPILAALAEDFAEQATVARLDVDREIELAERYAVRAIPAMLLFVDGRVVQRCSGPRSRRQLARCIHRLTGNP